MTDFAEKSCQTRIRLLEVAGEVFAEQGFRNATIRDICRAAEANVAAVNYHFGDKEGLYAAVLKYAHQCALEKFPTDVPAEAAPVDRLGQFVESMLRRMLGSGRPAWQGKLMAREMVEPTAGLDQLVEESIRPHSEQLESIVRDFLRAARASGDSIASNPIDDGIVGNCARSIVGQCFYYRHAQPVLERLYPGYAASPDWVAKTASHIVKFSISGLQGFQS
jgi:AcrR family transcriptional regulator